MSHQPNGRSAGKLARSTGVAVITIAASACVSYTTQVETAPPPEPIASKSPSWVRLRLKNQQLVEMYEPRLQNDSIIGFTQPAGNRDGRRIAVATGDVAAVSYRKFDAGKTVITTVAAASMAFIALGLIAILSCAASGNSYY